MTDAPSPAPLPRTPEDAWRESREQQAWVLQYAARKVFFLMIVGVVAMIATVWWIGRGG